MYISSMSQFKKATQGAFAPTITLNAESNSIESGKAKFIGNHIVGILMKREEKTTDNGTAPIYEIHLYADPKDESKFGTEPDGEVVSLWGGDIVLRNLIEEGDEGAPIPVGSCISIECLGREFGKSGFAKSKGYINYSVGHFVPKAKFTRVSKSSEKEVSDTPKTNTRAPKQTDDSLEELGF
jgi:hypothetical protein